MPGFKRKTFEGQGDDDEEEEESIQKHCTPNPISDLDDSVAKKSCCLFIGSDSDSDEIYYPSEESRRYHTEGYFEGFPGKDYDDYVKANGPRTRGQKTKLTKEELDVLREFNVYDCKEGESPTFEHVMSFCKCIDDISSDWEENAKGYLKDYEDSLFDVYRLTDKELASCCERKPNEKELKVLRSYLEDVFNSKGFHISVFPGHFHPMTEILPHQSVVEEGDESKEFQEIMSLTKKAMMKYCNEKNMKYEVLQIDEVNMKFSRYITYYVTFSAKDMSVKDVNSVKSFQAKLLVNHIEKKEGVIFCRPEE